MPNSKFHGVFSSLLANSGGERGARGQGVGILSEESMQGEQGALQQPQNRVGQLALDIYEEDGYTIIKAPIAGVKLADLDIDIVDNKVTIRGKREQCDAVEDGQYFLKECYWGEFSRSVTLPHSINPSKVKATFSKDNILKIYIPKEKKVRIVKINEGG